LRFVERQILLNNVFSELRHKELNIATHSGVTRTLEGFLPLFSPYKLRAFLFHLRQRYPTTLLRVSCRWSCRVVSCRVASRRVASCRVVSLLTVLSSYMRLSTDCAGSHIFEKVIGLFGKFLGDEAADADEELDDGDGEGQEAKEKIPSCVDTLLGVCDELTPELGALTTDNYSTHVVRTLLRVLAGLPPSEPKTEQEKDDAQSVAPKKVVLTAHAHAHAHAHTHTRTRTHARATELADAGLVGGCWRSRCRRSCWRRPRR